MNNIAIYSVILSELYVSTSVIIDFTRPRLDQEDDI